MTHEEFIQWLDTQIEENDRRMDASTDGERSSYYLGCATAMVKAKEKYLSLSKQSTHVTDINVGDIRLFIKLFERQNKSNDQGRNS